MAQFKEIVPISKLSDFENGKKGLNEDIVCQLYQKLGMQYEVQEDTFNILQEIVKNLYLNVIRQEDKQEIYQQLEDLKNLAQYDSSYFVWLLGDLLYHVYEEKEGYSYIANISTLKKHMDFLDAFDQQLFYDVAGCYYMDTYDYDQAIEYFDMAIQSKYVELRAMASYHKTIILVEEGHYIEGLDYIKNATHLFTQKLCLNRVVMCNVILGNLYSGLNDYEEAEAVYLNCLYSAKQLSFPNSIVIYNNLMWINLLSGHYEKVRSYGKEALDVNPTYAMVYFYISYACHKHKEDDLAKEYIRRAKKNSSTSSVYRQAVIDAYYTYISEKKSFELKQRKFLKAYHEALDEKDIQAAIFVLDILSDLCEENGKKNKELFYKTEMINLYKRRR